MSLVAYTASDGESSTDYSDDEAPSESQNKADEIAISVDFAVSAPKSPSTQNDDDELEDYVKPKVTQSCDVSKPTQKKRKQTVKIGIPALQEDSDDEEDQRPAKKKVVSSSGKSGLTSMLPPPVNAVKKEANRILIPHSLKKNSSQTTNKAQQINPTKSTVELPKIPLPPINISTVELPVKNMVSSQNSTTKPSLVSSYLSLYGSDSDEEETSQSSNFFSLDKTSESSQSSSNTSAHSGVCSDSKADYVTASLHPPSLTSDKQLPPPPDPNAPLMFKGNNSASVSSSPFVDAPLEFKPSNSNQMSSVSYSNAPYVLKGNNSYPIGPVSHQAEEGDQTTPQDDSEEGSQDVPYYPQAEEYYCHAEDDESQYQEENQHLLLDEQFLRIQGKHGRGREEINIVDVNADDYAESSDLTKSLTEESEYQSHRKKDNMPSSQQKRKKQITYLAFQAKERELTLKNQWANNRMTKKQTQSKYGF